MCNSVLDSDFNFISSTVQHRLYRMRWWLFLLREVQYLLRWCVVIVVFGSWYYSSLSLNWFLNGTSFGPNRINIGLLLGTCCDNSTVCCNGTCCEGNTTCCDGECCVGGTCCFGIVLLQFPYCACRKICLTLSSGTCCLEDESCCGDPDNSFGGTYNSSVIPVFLYLIILLINYVPYRNMLRNREELLLPEGRESIFVPIV